MASTSQEGHKGHIAQINGEYDKLKKSRGLNSLAVAIGRFAPQSNSEAALAFYEKAVTLEWMRVHDRVTEIQTSLAQKSVEQRPDAFHQLLNEFWLQYGLPGISMFVYDMDMAQIKNDVRSVNPLNFKLDYPQQEVKEGLKAVESINGMTAYSQKGVEDSIHGPQTINVPATVGVANGVVMLTPIPYENDDGYLIDPKGGRSWGDGWETQSNHSFGVLDHDVADDVEEYITVKSNLARGCGSISDDVSFINPFVESFINWQATKQQVLLREGQPMTNQDTRVLQSMYDRFNPPAAK